MTQQLSPAALAVVDAYTSTPIKNGAKPALAAALRAAADQVVPEGYSDAYDCCLTVMEEIRAELLAIADALEAQ